MDLNPGHSAFCADALLTDLQCQLAEREINPNKLSHLQITLPLSFLRLDFLNDIFLFVDSIYSIDVHSWFYLLSIVFLDISMPLLESMLWSSLLTPVEIGPSNASPGKQRMNERKEQIKNMTLAWIWTQVIRHFAPTLYQLSYGVSWQNLNSKKISFHISKPLRRYLSFVWNVWTTYVFLLTVFFQWMSTVESIYSV